MGFSKGFRQLSLAVIGVLIPQISLPQVGAPSRIEVQPLIVPVKKVAKRILASETRREPIYTTIDGRLIPAWALKSPTAYSENESYLSNFKITAGDRGLINQGDLMSQRRLLELKQAYSDMNRDYDQRSVSGANDAYAEQVQYDRMKNFSWTVFSEMRAFQGSVYRAKLQQVASRDPNLTSDTVKVVGGIGAVYFNAPILIPISEQTKFSARTSIPDSTGQLAFTSPILNTTLDMDGHAEDGLPPGTIPIDPTWTREKYRLTLNRPLPFGLATGASYGSTTTQVSASVSKPINDHVTCVVDSVRPLNAPGAVPEERVKVLYGVSF